ncbi:MAG: FAD-dependent oxidoreductase [Burkholderiales bacterium]|nr:FAD-dependent oxidoreductase [Burkholderiales bacterium]
MLAAIAAFVALGGRSLLTLEALKAQQATLATWHATRPVGVAASFFAVYVAVTGLSLPGAAVMTLVAGALFGVVQGTLIVSFASTAGATLAFLASRFLLRDTVQKRFGDRLRTLNAGIEKEGAFYLFTLRLVPAVPFFVINLAMGLTPMRAATFWWVSQLGMLAGTVAYVNAGTQLARIDSLRGIVSPTLLGSFVALGVLPLVARRVVDAWRARQVYRGWNKPARFDRNLIVIGAGSAGLVSAYIAAAVKAKVTLIERHRMGGDCLNTGCVPSKALIRTAKLATQIRHAQHYGLADASARVDFAQAMERVQRVIADIAPHDSVERYTRLGVECLQGDATLVSPWAVQVRGADGGTRTLTARSIVIAAGGRPTIPPIPGIDAMAPLTSDTVWTLREQPARLLVLGGGPIGCELAQTFARLGSHVTQVEAAPRLLVREDPEVSSLVERRFADNGVVVCTGHKAVRFEADAPDGARVLVAQAADGAEIRIAFDVLLCATGRTANTTGYGLEALGIGTTPQRTLEVDGFMATKYPNIYACGDVAGPYQFTHTAAHTAWYAAVNALFGRFKRFRADFRVIPWCTFTDPEVARVGLSETEAVAQGVPHAVTRYGLDDLDRAIADGEAEGFVKVLTTPGSDRILGATIVGTHAGDMLAEFVLAMRHGLGMNQLLGTIHLYPSFMEGNKFAAGEWKRAQVKPWQTTWLARYHAWMRG